MKENEVKMEKKFKLGVIGAGFMATALINGALSSAILDKEQIYVCDLSDEALFKISQKGICVTKEATDVVNNSEFVLFAIKPQNLAGVLEYIKNAKGEKFISIMAGVKKSKIKSVFPNSRIARCMPNTPCAIGAGAVGLDISDFNDEKDVSFIKNLFSSLSNVVLVSEDKLNAVTGVSGSSPAYFYLFIKGIIDAGVKNGLTYEEAKNLATSTMIGAGKMILSNPEKSIDDLINAVCSKGGTTIEAIKIYNENDINSITDKAVGACIKRSAELESL